MKVVWMDKVQWVLQSKFDNHHIYSVREKPNIKVFATYRHSAGLTLIITLTHVFHMSQKPYSVLGQAVLCGIQLYTAKVKRLYTGRKLSTVLSHYRDGRQQVLTVSWATLTCVAYSNTDKAVGKVLYIGRELDTIMTTGTGTHDMLSWAILCGYSMTDSVVWNVLNTAWELDTAPFHCHNNRQTKTSCAMLYYAANNTT